NEREAIRLVGIERYRLWMAYLVGMSLGFADGSLRIFQVLSTKHETKGHSNMPSTREHLYAPMPSQSLGDDFQDFTDTQMIRPEQGRVVGQGATVAPPI